MAFADHAAARIAIESLQSAVAALQNAANSVISVNRLGVGTPAAGRYVDGGTGAWTPLPAGGGGDTTALDARLDTLEAQSTQVVSKTRLGTGAPVAGSYVDGGTGAWTPLPAGGGGGTSLFEFPYPKKVDARASLGLQNAARPDAPIVIWGVDVGQALPTNFIDGGPEDPAKYEGDDVVYVAG